jgi:hypothetical protein
MIDEWCGVVGTKASACFKEEAASDVKMIVSRIVIILLQANVLLCKKN